MPHKTCLKSTTLKSSVTSVHLKSNVEREVVLNPSTLNSWSSWWEADSIGKSSTPCLSSLKGSQWSTRRTSYSMRCWLKHPFNSLSCVRWSTCHVSRFPSRSKRFKMRLMVSYSCTSMRSTKLSRWLERSPYSWRINPTCRSSRRSSVRPVSCWCRILLICWLRRGVRVCVYLIPSCGRTSIWIPLIPKWMVSRYNKRRSIKS